MKPKSAAKTTATGVSALASVYYDRAMIANLKANTSFSTWDWRCVCGQPVAHRITLGCKSKRFKRQKTQREIGLCESCNFRYIVMKAAGRVDEFVREYDRQKGFEYPDYTQPLPNRSGKTIQMFKYEPLKKS